MQNGLSLWVKAPDNCAESVYGITAGTLIHEKEEDVARRVANSQKKHNTHTASFNSHKISFFVPIMGVFLPKNLTQSHTINLLKSILIKLH